MPVDHPSLPSRDNLCYDWPPNFKRRPVRDDEPLHVHEYPVYVL